MLRLAASNSFHRELEGVIKERDIARKEIEKRDKQLIEVRGILHTTEVKLEETAQKLVEANAVIVDLKEKMEIARIAAEKEVIRLEEQRLAELEEARREREREKQQILRTHAEDVHRREVALAELIKAHEKKVEDLRGEIAKGVAEKAEVIKEHERKWAEAELEKIRVKERFEVELIRVKEEAAAVLQRVRVQAENDLVDAMGKFELEKERMRAEAERLQLRIKNQEDEFEKWRKEQVLKDKAVERAKKDLNDRLRGTELRLKEAEDDADSERKRADRLDRQSKHVLELTQQLQELHVRARCESMIWVGGT